MNRNNGREIGTRLIILGDFLFSIADKTHAISVKDKQREYSERAIQANGDPLYIKTIYSDLTALQIDFGVEVEYSEKHKDYILGRRSRRKTACTRKGTGCFGAAGQIRTADLILTNYNYLYFPLRCFALL